MTRELPNGWTYQLSQWIEYTPDRRTFEGTGLAPDLAVAQTADEGKRGVDAVLDRVLTSAR